MSLDQLAEEALSHPTLQQKQETVRSYINRNRHRGFTQINLSERLFGKPKVISRFLLPNTSMNEDACTSVWSKMNELMKCDSQDEQEEEDGRQQRVKDFMSSRALTRKEFASLSGLHLRSLNQWLDSSDMKDDLFERHWMRIEEFLEASQDEEPPKKKNKKRDGEPTPQVLLVADMLKLMGSVTVSVGGGETLTFKLP